MNLGSAYRYLVLSSGLEFGLPPFIIQNQQTSMQRQYIHLPNLNSLYLQNTNYQKHREYLKKSRSTYQTSKEMGVQSKEIQQRFRECPLPSQPKTPTPHKETAPLKYHSLSPAERYKASPHQKRKMSERLQENHRLYKALQYSVPIVSAGSPKGDPENEALKARISRFTKEGNLVVYKFKKSLAQITRRRQQKKSLKNGPVDAIRQAKQRLSHILDMQCRSKLEKTAISTDIYINLESGNPRNPERQTSDKDSVDDQCVSLKSSEKRNVQGDLSERYRISLKSQRCKTDPFDSTYRGGCNEAISRSTPGQDPMLRKVQQHATKELSSLYLVPKSELFAKKKSRQQLNDLQVICLPQVTVRPS